MADTYTLIASTIVGSSNASSIDFTNIPSTYTDLALHISIRSNLNSYSTDRLALRFNSDSGSNYSWKSLQGFGSFGVTSQGFASQTNLWCGLTTDLYNVAYSSTSVYIPNYTSSIQKSIQSEGVAEASNSAELMVMVSGIWTGTSAINSISIFPHNTANYNFNQYSTAHLYGIKNS